MGGGCGEEGEEVGGGRRYEVQSRWDEIEEASRWSPCHKIGY